MVKVGVVGGGIIGISSALQVKQQFPDAQVVIYAEKLPPNTTGDVAAGLWEPYAINDDPRITRWGKLTYDYLYKLLRCPEQRDAGVGLRPCYQLVINEADHKLPFWTDAAYGMRLLAKEEVSMYPHAVGGYTFTAPICEGKRHNAWLLNKFLAAGGTVINRKINSFSELVNENFDFIINCPGLGAKTLCNDEEMYPVRGQVRRVRAPWMNFVLMMTNASGGHVYIIPNADTVVLGGTQYKDDWGTDVRESDIKHIVESTSELIPSLKDAEVVSDAVGLRPGRTSVRLELEKLQIDGKELKVIHNYGHGGSGYTLFHGCSLEVLEILKKELGSA